MEEQFVRISPSILAINFNDSDVLKTSISNIELAGADFVHLDVMDGNFVQNKTFDYKLVAEVRKMTNLVLDVHLMIENPEKYIDEYIKAGADIISVHYEACKNLDETIRKIKEKNICVGIAISPETPVIKIKKYIENCDIDMVIVMSVKPGAGGQSFIPAMAEKIVEIKELNPKVWVEVDGGVNTNNATLLRKLGANVLVSGSCIFKSKNMTETIQCLNGDSFVNTIRNSDVFK